VESPVIKKESKVTLNIIKRNKAPKKANTSSFSQKTNLKITKVKNLIIIIIAGHQ
jgi:hypothetical protein